MFLYTICPACQAGYDVTDLLRGKKKLAPVLPGASVISVTKISTQSSCVVRS